MACLQAASERKAYHGSALPVQRSQQHDLAALDFTTKAIVGRPWRDLYYPGLSSHTLQQR